MEFDTTLVFSVTLLGAVLLSRLARRSLLSTAVLFLGVGVVAGSGGMRVIDISEPTAFVSHIATLTLFVVLFTDGLKLSLSDLRSGWQLPGRALGIGLPLTLIIVAILAYGLLGLPLATAFLVAAALAPTDPVFAHAIVGRNDLPEGLRQLLNVESGLNDGLSLPIVVGLIAALGPDEVSPPAMALRLAAGVAIGIVVPVAFLGIDRIPSLSPVGVYRQLYLVAIAAATFSLAGTLQANEFLAGFSAGIAVRTVDEGQAARFERLGEPVAEALKLFALLLLGSLVTPSRLGGLGASGWLFAVSALVIARPIAILLALARTNMPRQQRLVAAWFGPKGFASVVYALLVVHSQISDARELFAIVLATVCLSIVLHSSSDVAVARWLHAR